MSSASLSAFGAGFSSLFDLSDSFGLSASFGFAASSGFAALFGCGLLSDGEPSVLSAEEVLGSSGCLSDAPSAVGFASALADSIFDASFYFGALRIKMSRCRR